VATGRYVDPARYDEVTARIRAAVEAFHSTEPQRLGPGIAAVAGELDMRVDAPVFRHALDGLIAREELRESGDTLSRPGFDPFARLGDRDRAALEKIEGAFTAAGLAGAPWQQLIGSDRLRQSLFSLLLQSGRLVRLRTYDRAAQIVLHADAIRAAIDEIAGRYPYPSPFAVKDARDLLNSTRRHVVPLLEHLDAIGATERTGDLRRLRQQ
jgi:selenocysteine-specific elongation factor